MVEEKGVKTERTENPSGDYERSRRETERFSSRVDGRGRGRAGQGGGGVSERPPLLCARVHGEGGGL